MRVSTDIINDQATNAEIQIRFWEGEKTLHTLTVFVDDPHSYDGSIGVRLGALRKAQQVLTEMQEVILEAIKPENDPRELPA